MSEPVSQCILQCPFVQVCWHSFALHLMLVQFFSQTWLQSPWSVVQLKLAQLPPKHSLLHSFAVHLISQAPCAQVCWQDSESLFMHSKLQLPPMQLLSHFEASHWILQGPLQLCVQSLVPIRDRKNNFLSLACSNFSFGCTNNWTMRRTNSKLRSILDLHATSGLSAPRISDVKSHLSSFVTLFFSLLSCLFFLFSSSSSSFSFSKDLPLEHSSPHPSPSQPCLQLSALHSTCEQFSAQFWTTSAPLASKPQFPFSQCWVHFDVAVQFTREQFLRQVWVQSSPEHSTELHFPDRHRW